MKCVPHKDADNGSLHVLIGNNGVGEKTFQWDGRLWSVPGNPFGCTPDGMSSLGWKYVRPASDIPAQPAKEETK